MVILALTKFNLYQKAGKEMACEKSELNTLQQFWNMRPLTRKSRKLPVDLTGPCILN
jgi:hypothetical protein